MPRTEMSRLYICFFFIPPLRFDSKWTGMDCLKWSPNWIVIFSHRGIQVRQKKASCSGLVWLPFFSPPQSPLFAQWDFFSPTSRSLSLNLLCSTWKEIGYCSFGFLPSPISNRSILSLSPNTKPPYCSALSGEATVASAAPQCHKSSFTAAQRVI